MPHEESYEQLWPLVVEIVQLRFRKRYEGLGTSENPFQYTHATIQQVIDSEIERMLGIKKEYEIAEDHLISVKHDENPLYALEAVSERINNVETELASTLRFVFTGIVMEEIGQEFNDMRFRNVAQLAIYPEYCRQTIDEMAGKLDYQAFQELGIMNLRNKVMESANHLKLNIQ